MDLDYLTRGIRSLGLKTVLATVRYAWMRDRINRRFGQPVSSTLRSAGQLLRQDPAPAGASFLFQSAELEITFLSPTAVRTCWSPGTEPPPYSLAKSPSTPVDVEVEEVDRHWHLSSPELTVILSPTGELTYQDSQERVLRREHSPSRRGEHWQLQSELAPEEVLFGLGERAAPLNLRPGQYRFWNTDPGGSYGDGHDPLYLGIPLYQSLQSKGSYLIYYENSFDGQVTFDRAADIQFEGGQLRSVFLLGDPKSNLQQLADLIGRPALPPRWALGYHHSRWGFQDLAEINEVLAGFEEHDLPLDALHLDIDYMDGFRVFTQDPERFPDFHKLSQDLQQRFGAKLVAILDPGVKIDPRYHLYVDGLAEEAFCRLPNGQPLSGVVWPGWVHFPDFTDPKTRRWWGRQYRFLLEQGVDGFWHDMNEPTSFAAWGDLTFPKPTQHEVEGRGGDHRAIHNLYGLMMNRAGFEGLKELRPDHRPWLLSRSGWAGLNRFAWHWTGDTESSWSMLARTISTVLGLGLSGVPYSGPDIGGFSGQPSAELYVRWFQLAALMPFFRNHSSKLTPPREPWTFDEQVLPILRRYLKLRQSLLPYLYTLAEQSHRTGWPLVRPLFWMDPADPSLWRVDDCFLLGDHLLAAPVLAPGREQRELNLPAGTWVDFWTEQRYHGPTDCRLPAPLDRLPLLVRSGSVLPMAEGDELVLHLFPPEPSDNPIESTLYLDAGDGYGPSRLDRFRLWPTDDGWQLSWRSQGDYEFPDAKITLQFHAPLPATIELDGERAPLEGDRLHIEPFDELICHMGENG